MEWLLKLHEYFLDEEPFVVATACNYRGSSPETPGVALIHSNTKTQRFTSSDQRCQAILESATEMLLSPTHYRTEELALGMIAGVDNGYCDVIYEYFDAQFYPDWLRKLRTYSLEGASSTLIREFDLTTGDVVRTDIHHEPCVEDRNVPHHPAGIDCWTNKTTTSLQLFREVANDSIVVALLGNHPVAVDIQKQCAHLPIKTVRLHSIAEHLPEHRIVIIMTTNHELDYQFCEAILKKADDNYFIGCIGSKKKAQIFSNRLLQNGVSKSQLKQLRMPVGLAEIGGKQNAVVAASIVAQILIQHKW